MKALLVFLGLTFGNFIAQCLKADGEFIVAFERSYFQGWALLTYWAMDKFVWSTKNDI
jgi:hypothetical protein